MRTLPPAVAQLVEAAGGVPDPYESDMHARRFVHRDLLDLHDDEIEGERVMVGIAWAALVRNRYLACDRELGWFTERRSAVLAEIERRQRWPSR